MIWKQFTLAAVGLIFLLSVRTSFSDDTSDIISWFWSNSRELIYKRIFILCRGPKKVIKTWFNIRLRSICVDAVVHASDLLFPTEFPEFHHSIKRRIVQKRCASFREAYSILFEPFLSQWMHSEVGPAGLDNRLHVGHVYQYLYFAWFPSKCDQSKSRQLRCIAYLFIGGLDLTLMYRFEIASFDWHLSHDIFRIEYWLQIHPSGLNL